MEFYPILVKAHGGMAMLVFLLAGLSLLVALFATLAKANGGVLKAGNITGLLETICAGIVTLTGIVVTAIGPLPLGQAWIWIGLVIMVIYSILLKRLTKPARLAVADGGGAAKWAGFQLVHVVLLVIGFALMKMKPF
jgi:hypothetical protein